MFPTVGEAVEIRGGAPRLRPEMASLRLIVLDFVQAYLARWRHSPSYGEIAAGVDISRKRAFKAVRSLERDGLILRRPGPRGLAMPDQRDTAVRMLTALGWVVAPAGETDSGLLPPPALDYPSIPGAAGFESDHDFGAGDES